MAKLGISTGTNPNDGSGDSLLAGAVKINSNFNEVYAAIGNGSTVSTPVTSITAGDNIIVSGSTGSVTITGIGTADIDTDRINVSGVVTASSFSGSGVNLTNLSSSALVGTLPAVSGANLTGIATFIDAGANITVTTGPTGVTTIASSSGSGNTSNVRSNTLVVSGVSTFTGNVSFASSALFGDSDKILLGAGNDFEIYHSGFNRIVSVGVLTIDSDDNINLDVDDTVNIRGGTGSNETLAKFVTNGSVELYYDNAKKFETTGSGVTVTGGVDITGNIDSTNLETGTGSLTLGNSSSQFDIRFSPSSGSSPAIRYNVTDGISIYGRYNGGADLLEDVRFGDPSYFKNIIPKADSTYNLGSNSTKWATVYSDNLNVGTGASITGISTFSGDINLNAANIVLALSSGSSDDRLKFHTSEIYQDTLAFRIISNTGGINLRGGSTNSWTNASGAEEYIVATENGSVDLYYDNSKKLETTGYGVTVSGIVSATSYTGDGSELTDGKWTLGANGTSDYTFTGIGLTQTTNDPILYLARGRVYEFVNSMGAHPFEIRQSAGGSAYNSGVTNNAVSNGTLRFEIPFDAPNTLYYQCTSHAGMGSTIVVYPNTI